MAERYPLVLIHGLDDTARLFRRMRAYLEERGWDPHVIELVPNDGSRGLDELARQVGAFASGAVGAAGKFSLVGFSMGGLVARYYVQRLDAAERVHRLVTISSPHRGTWTGYLRWNKGAAQMRPGSTFLKDLEADRDRLRRVRFTSIWTPLDLMILPAASSVMEEARMVRIPVPYHAGMVKDARVHRAVEEALRFG